MKRVRGSQETVPYVEIGKSNVRIRTNVEWIEEEEFTGWEYDEDVLPLNEYIDMLASQDETEVYALLISMLMQEIDDLKVRIAEMDVVE